MVPYSRVSSEALWLTLRVSFGCILEFENFFFPLQNKHLWSCINLFFLVLILLLVQLQGSFPTIRCLTCSYQISMQNSIDCWNLKLNHGGFYTNSQWNPHLIWTLTKEPSLGEKLELEYIWVKTRIQLLCTLPLSPPGITVSLWNVPQNFHKHQRAEELQIAACRGAVTMSRQVRLHPSPLLP